MQQDERLSLTAIRDEMVWLLEDMVWSKRKQYYLSHHITLQITNFN